MITVLGVLLMVALFMLFPLVKRERKSSGCATGGCWQKRLGVGCGSCPLEPGDASSPRAVAQERPGD